MKYTDLLKIILCIIVLFVVLYSFYNSRVSGCMDVKAINYNKDANSYKKDSCIYETLGCTDPNAVNFNKWANTSCIEDCNGSNNSKCDFTKSCSSTPEFLCKYNIKGCSRSWAKNNDDKAVIDDNSCLTMEDFMSRIVILSGGSCNGCSNKVYIKIDNDYIINGGYDGINMVVIDRNLDPITNKINVRYIKHFNTGATELASDEFVDFSKNYLSQSDIIIIAVKGDAIGQHADTLRRVISQDALSILQKLGAVQYEFLPNGSYILIGSFLLDIYFESSNNKRDSYYPLFNLVNLGCINIYYKSFKKIKLDLSKNKMITTSNQTADEFVWRCALEVHSLGYDVYMIKGKECYIIVDNKSANNEANIIDIYKKIEEPIFYKPKTTKFNNASTVRQYISNNWMVSDSLKTDMATNIGNNICTINQFFQTIGSYEEENYYMIEEAFHSKYYVNDIGTLYTYIYSADTFTGAETSLETGIQTPLKVFSQRTSALANGGFEMMPVASMKVPAHHYVISFKTINVDGTLNDITIPQYHMFSGPSTAELKKNTKYSEYPLIVKDQKFTSSVSTMLIINGYGGVLLFEQPNYNGLTIRLAYGRYVLPDLYTKPYLPKIINMITNIFYDLGMKIPTFIDKSQNPKDLNSTATIVIDNAMYVNNIIKSYYDINILITIIRGIFELLNYKNYNVSDDKFTITLYSNENKPTFLTPILNYLASGLTFTSSQFRDLLNGIFKLMQLNNIESLTNKYIGLIDGMPIGSLKSYLKGNTCIRFFSDDNFNKLIYTWYVRRIATTPYAGIKTLPNNDDMMIVNQYDYNILCKSVIVDKLGFIKIYGDLNPFLFYTTITYDGLKNEDSNPNFIYVQSFKEFDNQDSNANTINPIINTTVYSYNWNPNAGIPIDQEVAIIRLMSVIPNDNINIYFFINQYKSLYEQFRKSIFNLLNFTNDDIPSLPPFMYYKTELYKVPNNIIMETDITSDIDFPIIKGLKVKLGQYNVDKGIYTFETSIMVNNKYDSYFYSNNNKIVYLGSGNNIFIANLPILNELTINDFSKTLLTGYDLDIKFGIIQLTDKNNEHKYFHIHNGNISSKYNISSETISNLNNGILNYNYKTLSLIGYIKITIYNLNFNAPLIHFSRFITNRNQYKLDSVDEIIDNHTKINPNDLIKKLNGIYGGLNIYDNNNNIIKHIPIIKNQFFESYRWIDINKIIEYLPPDISIRNISYYNLLIMRNNGWLQEIASTNGYYSQIETENNSIDYDNLGVYICEIEGLNIDNINKISLLKNTLTQLKVSCFLQVIYQPFEDDDVNVLDQYDNYQLYIFRNNNGNIIFNSGTRMISVVGGNWNITFTHDIYTSNIVTSTLYIPSPNNKNIDAYDRTMFLGDKILHYKTINNIDTLVATITSDVFMNSDLNEYDYLLNVKKYWTIVSTNINVEDINGDVKEETPVLEPVFIEYLHKTSRWIIKMPYNLPTTNITWKRYY